MIFIRTWGDILGQGYSDEDKMELAIQCRNSYPLFAQKYLGLHVDDFHNEMISYLFQGRMVWLQLPRQHGKTTLVSEGYNVWRLWREYDWNFGLTSSSLQTQSYKIMDEIQKVIMDNEALKHLVPTNRSETWNKGEINTTNGNKLTVLPFTDSALGTSLNLLIVDDLLRDSDITQEEIKNKFFTIFFPMVHARKGQIVFVGTPKTVDDLFYILSNDKTWVGKKWQAVITDESGKWIKPLWERTYSIELLSNIRNTVGSLIFDREYMCNPTAGSSSLFKEEILKKRSSLELSQKREGFSYYLGCDIALSEKAQADFSVFTVIERDNFANLRVVKIERYKGMETKDQIERIRRLHIDFDFRKILIEDVGLSMGMAKEITNDVPENPLRNVADKFSTRHANKELLVSRLEAVLSSGTLTLLDNEILLSELRNFGIKKDRKTGKQTYESLGGHDDCVMSLGLAVEAASGITGEASLHIIDLEEQNWGDSNDKKSEQDVADVLFGDLSVPELWGEADKEQEQEQA